MLVPVAGYAAESGLGTVGAGSNALVIRDGKAVQAVPGMPLFAGDRVVTRADGSAKIAMANNCTVSVGSSAMLPMSASSCAKPATVSFDQGRTGYSGNSSAFFGNTTGGYIVGFSFAAGLGGALWWILHNNHHHHHNVPTSP